MRFNRVIERSPLSESEIEILESARHPFDPERRLVGQYFEPEGAVIATDNQDFFEQLNRGSVDPSVMQNQNSDFEYKGACMADCESMDNVFGLQFVNPLDFADGEYQPAAWTNVQSALGLNNEFNPNPVSDNE